MSRILLFIIFILCIIAVVFLLRSLWQKFTGAITQVLDKVSKVASEQKQKWKQREQRKKLSVEIQHLILTYEKLYELNDELSEKWQVSLVPVYAALRDIVHVLSAAPKKVNKVRGLFSVSMPALEKFIETVKTDQHFMDVEETKKAQQNIDVITKDLLEHERVLQRSRRLDFDVLMDVIKVRLKKG